MTAVSTIFGMLPVAFGRGDGSEWRNPMGMISIGGLVTSTLLTLLVVPVVYTLVDDAQRGRRAARSRGCGAGATRRSGWGARARERRARWIFPSVSTILTPHRGDPLARTEPRRRGAA